MPSTAQAGLGDFAWSQGRLGYVLFFTLSGFLLYLPWVRSVHSGGEPPDVKKYLRRRAARILPAYYVALAASILLLYPIAGTPGLRLPPADSLPLFFVFGQNFTAATALKLDPPMWTLAVEVTYYLALPLLGLLTVGLAARRSRLTVPVALIAAGVVWNALVVALAWPLPATKVLPAMLPYFGVGMAAAVLWGTVSLSAGQGKRLLLGAGGLLLADLVLHSGLFPGALVRTLLDLPAAAGFAVIVAVAAASVLRLRVLDSRVVAAAGTISYGVYLWNVPVLLVLRSMGLLPLNVWAALPIVTAVSIGLGALSWFTVERPAIAWGRGRPRETASSSRDRP